MSIEEEILELIKSSEEGILQSNLWKIVNIDRRRCSRIIDKLKKEGIIIREPEISNGSRTYRIKYVKKKEKNKNFKLLIAGGIFSPCTGCVLECLPEQCMSISEWIFCLMDEE